MPNEPTPLDRYNTAVAAIVKANPSVRTVYKYPFNVDDEILLKMPVGAQILHIQTQREQPCLWALVNPHADTEVRCFQCYGTGEPIDTDLALLQHVGTFFLQDGALVFHLFEIPAS